MPCNGLDENGVKVHIMRMNGIWVCTPCLRQRFRYAIEDTTPRLIFREEVLEMWNRKFVVEEFLDCLLNCAKSVMCAASVTSDDAQ